MQSGSRSRCRAAARAGRCSSRMCSWLVDSGRCRPDGATLRAVSATVSFEERWPRPSVMGVLNVTPDSFSDGGLFVDPATRSRTGAGSSRRARRSSTSAASPRVRARRPSRAEEELARVEPVLEGLRGLPVSIDTSKAAVARRALELGAELVNDVTALRGDPDAGRGRGGRTTRSSVSCTCRASRGRCRPPLTTTTSSSEVLAFLEERVAFAVESGIAEERICVDPGHRVRQDAGPEPGAPPAARRAARARTSRSRRRVAEEHARRRSSATQARRPEASPRRLAPPWRRSSAARG